MSDIMSRRTFVKAVTASAVSPVTAPPISPMRPPISIGSNDSATTSCIGLAAETGGDCKIFLQQREIPVVHFQLVTGLCVHLAVSIEIANAHDIL